MAIGLGMPKLIFRKIEDGLGARLFPVDRLAGRQKSTSFQNFKFASGPSY